MGFDVFMIRLGKAQHRALYNFKYKSGIAIREYARCIMNLGALSWEIKPRVYIKLVRMRNRINEFF